MRAFILGLLLFFQGFGLLHAQTSRLWSIVSGIDYFLQFEDSTVINIYEAEPWMHQYGQQVSVFSNSSGKPLFSDHFYKIVDLPNFITIKGSDSIYPALGKSIFLYRNDSIVDLLSLANNYFFNNSINYQRTYQSYANYFNGYLFDSIKLAPSGLFLNTIKINTNVGLITKNKLLFGGFKTDGDLIDVKRKREFDYRCVIKLDTGQGQVIGSYANASFTVEDTIINLSSNQCFNRLTIPIPPGLEIYGKSYSYEAILNYKANRLYFLQYAKMGAKISGYNIDDLYRYYGMYYVDLDAKTGKALSEPKNILSTQALYGSAGLVEMPNGAYTSWHDLECSPNDSILYFVEINLQVDSVNGKRTMNYLYKVRYLDFGSNSPFVPNDLMVFKKVNDAASPRIELNPYGKLVIIYDQKLDSIINPKLTHSFKTLLNTNKPEGLNSQFVSISMSDIWGIHDVNLHLYDYIRLNNHIDYNCNATVNFTNKTDYSMGINTFEWYFTKENGKILQTTGVAPQITYTQSGDYFYKVRGFDKTKTDGYSEWYFDTLHIRIPAKPVAAFTATDTIICSWQAAGFNNLSNAANIHPTNPQKWVWTFGDGQTLTQTDKEFTQKVSHVYEQPGNYTVSLFYYNGYCDSTLVKNQYITVLPAPRPGIDVSPAFAGCSPLTLTFNRSFADAVDSIAWLWADGSQQTLLANPGTAVHTWYHTLSAPQTYAVVQRLYGPTGCITADTVAITVKPGFEHGYVPVLHRASIENGQTLLQWQGHPHAGQYHVFKNNAPLAQTADTFYWLKQQNADAFAVAAANGCGLSSAAGNTGKPMLLQGQNQSNKAALLQWTAYQDWTAQGGISHYTIEAQNTQGVFEPLAVLQTTQHTDNAFIQNGMYQRCYRVAATQSNNPQWVSHSNTLCLGYEAVIFVPDAFSPNNDGLNDVFTPFNIGFKNYTLSIYNRWGQKIAEGLQWDGTFNGNTVQPGLYYYTLTGKTGNNENVYLKGQVSVVR